MNKAVEITKQNGRQIVQTRVIDFSFVLFHILCNILA